MDQSMPDFEQDRLYKRWEKLHLEQLAVHENWRATGLCEGLQDYPSLQIAYLMENQRLINGNDEGPPWFKRISIPLTRRIFHPDAFIGWEIVTVQTSHAPVAICKTIFHGEPVYHEIPMKTRKLKCALEDKDFNNELLDEEEKKNILDRETLKVGEIARSVAAELNQEVLKNLHENASHKTTIAWKQEDGAKEVWPTIRRLRETIRDRTGTLPNWLVTSSEVAACLKDGVASSPVDNDPEWGVVKTALLDDELVLIENRETKSNDCILGYKGSNYSSQYIFSPYIAVTATPVVLSVEEFAPRRGMLMRYGKKLLSTADNYYGVLRIEAPK